MVAQFDDKGNVIIPKTMKFNVLGQPEKTIYTLQDKKKRITLNPRFILEENIMQNVPEG